MNIATAASNRISSLIKREFAAANDPTSMLGIPGRLKSTIGPAIAGGLLGIALAKVMNTRKALQPVPYVDNVNTAYFQVPHTQQGPQYIY